MLGYLFGCTAVGLTVVELQRCDDALQKGDFFGGTIKQGYRDVWIADGEWYARYTSTCAEV
jgi:hypothetical protein